MVMMEIVNVTMKTIVKVNKPKFGPFKYTESISKCGEKFLCIGNMIYFLIYLPDPFPRGL